VSSKPSMTKNRGPDGPATEKLWSIEDVSEFLRVPVGTLYQWRYHRTGPRAFKVGRYLRYDPADVRAWLTGQAA
jgi:predicted DNA-binding transcriptional regulator AlpA